MDAEGRLESEDVITLLASVPERAADLVGGIDENRARYRHGPAFPTLRELVSHLAAAGAAADALLGQIYLGSLEVVPPRAFDPSLSAGTPAAEAEAGPDAAELLQDYARSRRRAIDLLRGMREADWERRLEGSETGEVTVLEICRQIAGHEMGHLSQLRNLTSLLPEPQDLGPVA